MEMQTINSACGTGGRVIGGFVECRYCARNDCVRRNDFFRVLAKAVPLAFLAFVAGTALCGLFIALFSQFQCNLSGAQDEPAAILATFEAAWPAWA